MTVTPQTSPFGALLRQYRAEAHLTQEELAERARLSARAISDLERGVRRAPYRDTVRQLADVLDLDADAWEAFELAARSARTPHLPPDTPLPVGGYLGAMPAGKLVAREAEMAQIWTAVDAIQTGSGRVLLLNGEAGIGKTRIAQEVMRELRGRNTLVASGRCYDSRQSVPFYPFLEALTGLYEHAPEPVRTAVPRRWPYLPWLLPATPEAVPITAWTEPDEQERLFWSVNGFLKALSAERPVAVLLDDLHWVDGASLELMLHIARHTAGARVVLLGTYRDTEIGAKHPLQAALRDLMREHLVERVPIRRLKREGTSALVAELIEGSERLVDVVHRQTDGNPFFVRELVHSFSECGGCTPELLEDMDVPESIRAVVGQRLARLSPSSQELLTAASVLGEAFHFEDLTHMIASSTGRADQALESEIESGLTEAEAASLVRELPADMYAFDHALIQQTLYGELPSRRKRRLHRTAATAMEGTALGGAERVTELLRHWMEGGDAQRALPYALRVGEQAERVFAVGEAEAHYRTAVELAQEAGDVRAEARALVTLARLLARVERSTEAREQFDAAADRYRSLDDLDGYGQVVARMGHLDAHTGTLKEAVTRLQATLSDLEDRTKPATRAALWASLAMLYFCTGAYGDQLSASERAAALARQAGDASLQARADLERALALAVLGRVAESGRALDGVLQYADVSDDAGVDPMVLPKALTLLAERHRLAGRLNIARQIHDRVVPLQERLGTPAHVEFAHANVAELHFFAGNWQEAHRHLDQAVRSVGPDATPKAFTLAVRGRLLLGEGKWDQAGTHLEDARRKLEQKGIDILRIVQGALAERDILTGRPQEALARLAGLLDRPGLVELQVNALLAIEAWAHVERGDIQRAEEALRSGMERAAAQEDRLSFVEMSRVLGMALARQGRRAEAIEVLEGAAAEAGAMPYPHEQARILLELGAVYDWAGDRERGLERLAEAREISLRLGATKDVERAQQLLDGLGGLTSDSHVPDCQEAM